MIRESFDYELRAICIEVCVIGAKIGFLADLSPPSTSDSIEEAQINLKANIDFTSLLVKL